MAIILHISVVIVQVTALLAYMFTSALDQHVFGSNLAMRDIKARGLVRNVSEQQTK